MKIITIASRKGGVGKTHITAALAQIMASRGLNVGCLDCDSQANLIQLFQGKQATGNGLEDWLNGFGTQWIDLKSFNLRIMRGIHYNYSVDIGILKERLNEMVRQENLDFLFVDTPPVESELTQAMISVSDCVFAVTDGHKLGATGAYAISKRMREDQDFGFVLNYFKPKNRIYQGLVEILSANSENVICVPEEVAVARSTNDGKGIPMKGKFHFVINNVVRAFLGEPPLEEPVIEPKKAPEA